MIGVGYYDGIVRCGLLLWTVGPNGRLAAVGGIAPESVRQLRHTTNAITLVQSDKGCRVLAGWVHPDDICELVACAYGANRCGREDCVRG